MYISSRHIDRQVGEQDGRPHAGSVGKQIDSFVGAYVVTCVCALEGAVKWGRESPFLEFIVISVYKGMRRI